MADGPLFEHKHLNFKLTLHANRIDTEQQAFGGPKRETVPLRNIASVEKTALGKLIVKTNDGKKHEWTLGGDIVKVYDALMNAL